MIRQTVARALQISTMEIDQIEKLHQLENKKNHLIPNHNIQSLFKLPTIKESYGLSEDDLNSQAEYSQKIESEIERENLRNGVSIALSGLEWIHAFDFVVFNNKNKINWFHSSSKKGSLLSRMSRISSLSVFLWGICLYAQNQ